MTQMNYLFLLCAVLVTVDAGEKNVLDKIFEVNQVTGNEDTFSKNIKVELFEGDIVWTKTLKATIGELRGRSNDGMRSFDAISRGAWPGAVVPYTFASGFRDRSVVQLAINEYNRKTCIRWKPYTRALAAKAGGYVEFMHGGGCYSMIGMQGGKQQISLGRGCGVKGVAVHEMMHALGFFHEQSRRDRDSYITIYWNNINRAMWYNFEKYRAGQASTLKEPYDKLSIMHYGNYAFSINGRKTIVSKSNPNEQLGQRSGLSDVDVRQLRKYYKCKGGIVTTKKTIKKTCENNYPFCKDLTAWCSKNDFVKLNCKSSCKNCQTLSTARPTAQTTARPKRKRCVDKSGYCGAWAKSGYCYSGSHKRYMYRNCRHSCRLSC